MVERLLGLRRRGDLVEVDPVLPPGADGLTATVRLAGRTARVTYVVGPEGVGVRRVTGEHGDLALTGLDNPHRRPGAAVRTDDLRAAIDAVPDDPSGDLLMTADATPAPGSIRPSTPRRGSTRCWPR